MIYMSAYGAFRTCAYLFVHMNLFSCMFAYMHVHVCVSVCVWQPHMVHLAFASVIWSTRCQCVPEPLSFSSSRGPEPHVCVCVCVSDCVYNLAGRGKHSPCESHYGLCVCKRGCVYVCVLTNDLPGFFENYSLEEVEIEVLVCAKV